MSVSKITDRPTGHILTNINVWSPDGQWIVYDTRPDAAGEKFLGSSIEAVNVVTREVKELYRSNDGAHCGVATFSPRDGRVVFILGPENPTDDWQYGASRRQGVVVDMERPGVAVPLDGRDVAPPFTPGALRGGTHVHVFDPKGQWVRFTYEDHVLATLDAFRGQVYGRLEPSPQASVRLQSLIGKQPLLLCDAAWNPDELAALLEPVASELVLCGSGVARYPQLRLASARQIEDEAGPCPLVVARLGAVGARDAFVSLPASFRPAAALRSCGIGITPPAAG